MENILSRVKDKQFSAVAFLGVTHKVQLLTILNAAVGECCNAYTVVSLRRHRLEISGCSNSRKPNVIFDSLILPSMEKVD